MSKSLTELMREAIDDLDDDGSREIYVDGFGTWNASSLRRKITKDINTLAELANTGDFDAVHSHLSTGVLVSIVGALVANDNKHNGEQND